MSDVYKSFDFTVAGQSFTADLVRDESHGAPWDENDGHGVVSDWTTRDKAPGELVLAEDGRQRRFYDLSGSIALAKRDGWDSAPYGQPGETPAQKASRAARADFQYLRDWCNDSWFYCGVIVRKAGACSCCAASESLWGVESKGDYVREVALELAAEMLESVDA